MKLVKINNSLIKLNNKCIGYTGPYVPPDPFDTVTIGNLEWMKYNLAIDDEGVGVYSYDETAYGFGIQYFYTHEAAVRIANSLEGWHLPTWTDATTLINSLGVGETASYKLRSTYGWTEGNGSNESGFNALPVGNLRQNNSLESLYTRTCFWCSGLQSTDRWFCIRLNQSIMVGNEINDFKFSVRLVKNTN